MEGEKIGIDAKWRTVRQKPWYWDTEVLGKERRIRSLCYRLRWLLATDPVDHVSNRFFGVNGRGRQNHESVAISLGGGKFLYVIGHAHGWSDRQHGLVVWRCSLDNKRCDAIILCGTGGESSCLWMHRFGPKMMQLICFGDQDSHHNRAHGILMRCTDHGAMTNWWGTPFRNESKRGDDCKRWQFKTYSVPWLWVCYQIQR